MSKIATYMKCFSRLCGNVMAQNKCRLPCLDKDHAIKWLYVCNGWHVNALRPTYKW